MTIETPPERADFIREIVAADVRSGRHSTIVTRFPPEPNGYLHIGHAKSICLNFGVARDFGGRCHLRFDDTNPVKEEQEYIDAIERDIRWLGFDWGKHLYHASDYFEQLYDWAVHLIRNGDAYVDDLSADEIRENRGTLTEPGRNSPWRDRPVDENLDLFARMRAGEFPNGARVLRAKIDMASPNINLRDPVLYRIVHAAASADRRRVAHLPDVRLRARPVGCDRGRHPFDLHARVRGAPAAVRLADRASAGPLPAAAVRVRPAEHHLHRAVQALPAPARRGGPRSRLGRSAHADDLRPAPARLPGRGHPRLRRDGRGHEVGQRHRVRATRVRGSGRAQPLGAATLRRAGAPQGRHRELSRGPDRRGGGPEQPRGPLRREAARSLRARAVDRARRLHGGAGAEVLPARAGSRGAATGGVLHHVPGRREGRHRPGDRAALHLRPCDPRRRCARRSPAEGDAALGVGGERRPGRGAPLRPSLHASRPGRERRSAGRPQSELRDRADRRRSWSHHSPRPNRARQFSSSASATSRQIPIRGQGSSSSTGR